MDLNGRNDTGSLNIIIVGAGLVGLTAAAALRKQGHNIDIFESSSFKREIGAGMGLPPNCSHTLRGLFPEMCWDNLKYVENEQAVSYSADGSKKSVLPLKDALSRYPSKYYYSYRIDLHNELKRLALETSSTHDDHKPAKLHLGDAVVSCDFEEGSITMASGKKHTADLVIGADGIRSVIRQSLLGRSYNAPPSTISAYRWMMSVDDCKNDPDLSWMIEDGMEGPVTVRASATEASTTGFYFLYPCRDRTLYNAVAVYWDERDQDSFGWTTRATAESIQSNPSFPSNTFHSKFLKLLSYAPPNGACDWQIRQLPPLPTWTKGKGIIIGDAAHAMFMTWGQGFAMGVEDCAALSTMLSHASAEDIPSRLKLVENFRKPRAEFVSQASAKRVPPTSMKSMQSAKEYGSEMGVEGWVRDDIMGYDVIHEAQIFYEKYVSGKRE